LSSSRIFRRCLGPRNRRSSLYQAGDGQTYLYVEQQNGAQLAIFDVKDPAKIRAAASFPLKAAGAFDFVRYLSGRAELVRFRDSGQLAELDLLEPKSPTLKITNTLSEPAHTESLGQTGLVMINAHWGYVGGGVAHDYRVADVSTPAHPTPLATIKQVKHKVVNEGDRHDLSAGKRWSHRRSSTAC